MITIKKLFILVLFVQSIFSAGAQDAKPFWTKWTK